MVSRPAWNFRFSIYNENMRPSLILIAAMVVLAPSAHGQLTYCKDIGKNKTYCSGGTIIHHLDRTTVISSAAPPQLQSPATLPNPLPHNIGLPSLNAPYSSAGTQGVLPTPASVVQPTAPGTPVVVVPPPGSRICHQFGTALVCN